MRELQNLKSLRSVPLICVKITSSSGKESSLTVCLKETVKSLKDKALGGECSKESPFYKLILAKSNRELTDEKTLEEENVQENGKCHGWLWCLGITSFLTLFFFSFPDELILFKKRQGTTADIAEKVSLAMWCYRSFRLLASEVDFFYLYHIMQSVLNVVIT